MPWKPTVARPQPRMPPTIVLLLSSEVSVHLRTGTYVVEAGRPSHVKNDNDREDAIKAFAFPSMRAYGLDEKAWISIILLRIVSATLLLRFCQYVMKCYYGDRAYPAPTAPANSIIEPMIFSCNIVRDPDATVVAKTLETSFAPEFR